MAGGSALDALRFSFRVLVGRAVDGGEMDVSGAVHVASRLLVVLGPRHAASADSDASHVLRFGVDEFLSLEVWG